VYLIKNSIDLIFNEILLLIQIYGVFRRVAVRKDTCGIVAVSINISGQQYPVIWTMTNLPYDCFKAMAVPKPLGKNSIIA